MNDLLHYLTENLAEDTSAISIEELERESSNGMPETLFRLRVAPSDMGRVIGKQGRTAKDIRILMRAIASREGKRVSVDILDEDE
ncbi:MAG: KH domain-containing protein [Oscillospiraceae bacterium]|nr:KH domain-containing protein [Oscillospiraceae bacterium]